MGHEYGHGPFENQKPKMAPAVFLRQAKCHILLTPDLPVSRANLRTLVYNRDSAGVAIVHCTRVTTLWGCLLRVL
jgi:hypothetical protein